MSRCHPDVTGNLANRYAKGEPFDASRDNFAAHDGDHAAVGIDKRATTIALIDTRIGLQIAYAILLAIGAYNTLRD